MCDDIEPTMAEVTAPRVEVVEATKDKGYAIEAAILLPGGGLLRVCEP